MCASVGALCTSLEASISMSLLRKVFFVTYLSILTGITSCFLYDKFVHHRFLAIAPLIVLTIITGQLIPDYAK
jgi:hypothetical protein